MTLTITDDRWSQVFIDDELAPETRAAFQQRLESSPELARHIERHRRLKDAVADVMETTDVPAETRARIATLLSGRGPDVVGRIGADQPTLATKPSRWSFFTGPRRASFAAVAASLGFVGVAVVFGIYGPTINHVAFADSGVSMTEVATHVLHEHNRCSADDAQRAEKAPFRTPERAFNELSAHVGHPVEIIDLRSLGYEFCCAGFCMVPGAETHSGHIMYHKASGRNAHGNDRGADQWVSLFVAPAEVSYHALDIYGRPMTLRPGELYAESPENDSYRNPANRIYGWTDGSLVYFLRVSASVDAPHVIAELAPQFSQVKPIPRSHDQAR